MIGATQTTDSMSRPVSEPTDQKRYDSSAVRSVFSRYIVSEVSPAVTAAPVSASLTGPASPPPPRDPTAMTSAAARAAPMSANTVKPPGFEMPSVSTANSTATDAPAFTPSRPGSARGFRVSPCMRVPATPRAAPASTPMIMRGTRWNSTTFASLLATSAPVTASQTTCGSICRVPNARLATAASANRTTAATPVRIARVVRLTPGARTFRGASNP